MKLIVEERGRLVTYEIADGESAVIGRGLDNTIPIREPSASRKHCRVGPAPGGGALVEDLGSKNGTLLKGARVRGAAPLARGDCIAIGAVKIWFEERRGAPAAPRAPATEDAPERTGAIRYGGAAATPDPDEAPREPAPPILEPPLPAPPVPEPPPPAPPAEEAPTPAPEAPEAAERWDPARFSLEAVEGEHAGKRFAIGRLPFRIGRAKKNALRLQDTEVSGEHCEIVARPGGCAIVDLGSTNGTRLGRAKVKRGVLADGARLTIGGSVFVFHDALKPAPAAQPEASGSRLQAPGQPSAHPEPEARSPKPEAWSPEPADPLGGAAESLGSSAAMAAVEARSGRGALGAAVAAVAVLAAAGIFAAVALRSGEAPPDPDPPPRGNRIANWSFEDAPGPGGPPAAWRAAGAGLAPVEGGAGGARALRVTPADPKKLGEARSATDLPIGGGELQLSASVRGGPAALAVVWRSSLDPSFRLLSATGLVSSGEWTDLGAAFLPPPGADRATVALVAAGEATFDRVAATFRAASTGRAAESRVEAGGLEARLDDRGLFALRRDGWPIFDRGGLALEGGGYEDLARQEAAARVARRDARAAPRGAKGPKEKRPAGARLDGTILRPDALDPVAFGQSVEPGAGFLDVRYALAEGLAGVRPAIHLYMERLARAERFEVTLAATRQVASHAPPFEQAGVSELGFGAGAEAVSLRLDPPLAVRARPLGRGLLLTLAAAPGAREIGFRFGRGSTRERGLARMLFEEAEAEKRAGRLEEARRTFAKVAREFPLERALSERASRAEKALLARGEAALAEAAAIEADATALGAPELLASAEARCRFVAQAYGGPGAAAGAETSALARKANEALARIAASRARIGGAARRERARELLLLGRSHLDGRRFRLAHLYLRMVAEGFADQGDLAGEAARDAEVAERQLRGGGGS